MVKTPKYRVQQFATWESYRQALEGPTYRSWAFRGQANADWPLLSSLSRYLRDHNVHREAWPQQEERVLRIFKRKAHLLLDHLPADDDSFEWLALMQHHGAPTRLLDFSWSPYVATFFAFERATADASVWALFPRGLGGPSAEVDAALWTPGGYEKHYLPNKKRRLVVAGEPHRMNQRLIAQSGTFVVPGVLDQPVDELVPAAAVTKFVLDISMRRQAMSELYNMNIGNATLFPGLDGLARSLAFELEFHWAFDPVTMEARKGFARD